MYMIPRLLLIFEENSPYFSFQRIIVIFSVTNVCSKNQNTYLNFVLYTFFANLLFCIRNLGLYLDPLFARSLDPDLDLMKSHG
jgi:hypothetical protein